MMFPIFAMILTALTGAMASSYLEFCDLLGLQNRTDQGIILQAKCGSDGSPTCQELNIVPCLANAWGAIVPSGHTHGNFNGSCFGCNLGISKNDTETYGLLRCQCENGTTDSMTSASYQTNNLIRYESKLGMLCPYGNNSAVRSLDCPMVLKYRIASLGGGFHERGIRGNSARNHARNHAS